MSHGRVTPQLRHWIVKQIEAGQSPELVLESMIRNGWPEGTALDVMERTLRIRVAQIKAAENAAGNTPGNAADTNTSDTTHSAEGN